MGPQRRRHLGAHAEPVLEARHRLVQQHAESVDHPVAPGARRRRARASRAGYRRCRRRPRPSAARARSMSSGSLPVMPRLVALTSRPQPDSARLRSPPIDHLDRGPEGLRQRLGAAARAVGEQNPRDALRPDRPCRIARAAPPAPSTITGRRPSFQSGACFIEIGHEAIGVGVAGAEPPGLVEPQRVGGADRARRLVGHRRKLAARLPCAAA